ncbi:sulfotransferase [Ascidiaceihabitans sp.]|uniref:sulfotransferase n=1 Tax=Ascidiaceihabitans sp. TaxID=1872644 RepID=UPI003298A097
MSLSVVNLGLPKTGTTTLARALRRAGMHVADHRIKPKQTNNRAIHHQFVAELLYRGYYESGNPAALLYGFDAVAEMSTLSEGKSIWPQMDFGLIEALRETNPGVKFVASNRDSWDVSQSMLAWSNLGTVRLPESNIPGLPKGYGETSKERVQWIDAHYATLRAYFNDDDDFLEYEVTDPNVTDLLSGFVGVPITWWGRANANPENLNTNNEVA